MNRLKKFLSLFLAVTILFTSIIIVAGAKTINSIGDVSGDGKISAADARLALRFSASLDKPTEEQKKSADVNNDGKITASDARMLLRVSAGLDKFDIKEENTENKEPDDNKENIDDTNGNENTDNSSDNWHFEIDNNNVVKTNEFGGGYINNRVIIEFSNTNEEFIKDIVVSIDGKIIGFSETGTYQIEIQERTLDELKQLCKQLKGKEGIISAHYDIIGTTSRRLNEITIPNDPWKDTFQGMSGTDWDEYNPNGLNWWLETIEAPSAWQNNNRFKNNIIGIVDDGFDYQHEDLGITVLNNSQNSFEDHGTHVAGIIGATANNNTGITGIVWNKDLYCYDAFPDKKISLENACKGIESLLLSGCKTINLSSEWYVEDNEINAYGVWAIEKIIKWKENPDIGDFIIVQSAGNHAYDSLKAGLFASITEEAMKLYCDENETKYSYDDIIQHIMTVGAVEKTSSGYQMTDFSNYGSNVSICAPGKDIFSTVVMGGLDGNYDNMNGTSMAAPIVTGVASLVWSVNPDFSAGEVKDIVCHSYNKTADPYHYPTDVRVYPIVNAKLAVEEAIRRTDKKGTAKGTFVDSKTGTVVNNVKMECLKYTGDINNYSLSDFNIDATDGTFSCELYEGVYEYKIIADGYAQERNIILDIKTGKCDEKGKINLIPITKTSTITGTVTDSKTGNPISNVTVEVIDNASGSLEPVATAITDTNGKYSLELPYGSYSLSFNHENYEYYGTALSVNYEAYEENATLSPKGNSGETEERTVIDSGNCGADGDNVTWTLYEDGELVISGSGEMNNFVFSSSVPWYSNWSYIKYVTIKNGITSIGDNSFACCTRMTTIKIPASVDSIGKYAFIDYTRNTSIENIIVDFDNQYYSSEDGVLFDKNKTVLILYPENNSRKSYDIPKTVKTILKYAFSQSKNLESINIPDSVSTIEVRAFDACKHLENIVVNNSNQYYSSENGVLFDKNKTNLIQYPIGNRRVSYTIPNEIKIIQEFAFYECTNLQLIEMSFGVTSIGKRAFSYCESLISIEIPDSVTSIGEGAFYYCPSLASINIPSDIININDHTFTHCSSLTSIEIPNSVKYIGVQAFDYCKKLTSIEIPVSVNKIEMSAFSSYQKSITIKNKYCNIQTYAINNNGGTLEDIIIYGYLNSTAQTYAEKNNIIFVALD